MPETIPRCAHCGEPFTPNKIGRPQLYCSPAHRQAAYEQRRRIYAFPDAPEPSVEPLARLTEPDRALLGAVADALALLGTFRRLATDARTPVRHRCARFADAIDAALSRSFAEMRHG
jgi:hypothetical protein